MSGPTTVAVAFDAWFDPDGGVWIAESRTPAFGICTDAPTREALAAKLDVMTADAAEALFGHPPATVRISLTWTAAEASRRSAA